MSAINRLETILLEYQTHGDFEDARDAIHALGPEVMGAVLECALDERWSSILDLLVMCLADVDYPPAFPYMRTWLEHGELEGVALPAAACLAQLSQGRFDVERFWDGDCDELPATLDAIAAWWDAGDVQIESEAQWLEARQREREAEKNATPPPDPTLSAEEKQRLRPALIEVVQRYKQLTSLQQHRLDCAAISRVLYLYHEWAPLDPVLDAALTAVLRFLKGDAARDELTAVATEVTEAWRKADLAAAYNSIHGRYQYPRAKAAAEVAQGVLYVCSPEQRNRLQGLHYARSALEYSAAGVCRVQEELEWQRAQVEMKLNQTSAT